MRMWRGLSRGRRHREGASANDRRVPVDGSSAISLPASDEETAAHDRIERELVAASTMVSRGSARRVLVCNAPVTIDFDEVRLLADAFGVRIEPIIRVGGGAFDFAVSRGTSDDG